ncbi:hypothetical protein GCM10011316_13900 [Roseibium aquae]|uniref:Uncharacterized protein n=1 Tax=Roseibium aquae TaxID=1323746 RepID=A0A916THB5_9HYPH|nr:hypothetical protein [Roseibium aquae]GGB43153.1 hypothetical protein GCM10011316_13900 [Roseibium aquae]
MANDQDNSSASDLYDRPNVLFFVPYNVDVDAEVDELGAILRLGEYSDVEEVVRRDGYDDEYYPQQHIEDAGQAGKRSTELASGEDRYQKGILLACDGRFLIKTREKMYTDTADYHRRTRGTYKLVIDDTYTVTVSGDISITSGTGNINVKASAGDVAIESGTNKDITLRAGTSTSGGATGMIYEYSKGHYKEIDGHEYKVSQTENTFTTGTSSNFFFGAKSTVNGDADFTLTVGPSATVKPVLNLSITGVSVSYTASSIDLKNVYCNVRGIQTSSEALKSTIRSLKSEVNALNTQTSELRNETAGLTMCAEGIVSKMNTMDAEITELKAVI